MPKNLSKGNYAQEPSVYGIHEILTEIRQKSFTEKEKGKVIDAFNKYLEGKVPYYATSTMSDDSIAIQDYIDNLEHRSDRNDYIQNKGLHKLVKHFVAFQLHGETIIGKFLRRHLCTFTFGTRLGNLKMSTWFLGDSNNQSQQIIIEVIGFWQTKYQLFFCWFNVFTTILIVRIG